MTAARLAHRPRRWLILRAGDETRVFPTACFASIDACALGSAAVQHVGIRRETTGRMNKLRVKSGLRAGGSTTNHNSSLRLKVKSRVRAGGSCTNHNASRVR
jgi:hypothetical protein